jgi:hypothetical protein
VTDDLRELSGVTTTRPGVAGVLHRSRTTKPLQGATTREASHRHKREAVARAGGTQGHKPRRRRVHADSVEVEEAELEAAIEGVHRRTADIEADEGGVSKERREDKEGLVGQQQGGVAVFALEER